MFVVKVIQNTHKVEFSGNWPEFCDVPSKCDKNTKNRLENI
jgi:hypothetical protein